MDKSQHLLHSSLIHSAALTDLADIHKPDLDLVCLSETWTKPYHYLQWTDKLHSTRLHHRIGLHLRPHSS